MSDPRYPIGRFEPSTTITDDTRAAAIAAIEAAPRALRRAVEGLDDAQLDTPYREGGWTIRQLVHHVADSHVNAYARHKLTVAEEEPTIRAYDQQVWAELPETRSLPPEISLDLLDALHRRWSAYLRALPAAAFSRRFVHPEMTEPMSLDVSVELYAWHGRHHAAHVAALRESRGW